MAVQREVIGDCVLYGGDCREVLPMLEPVDAVVTDPPYGVGLKGKRTYRGHRQRLTVERPGHYSHADTPEYLQAVVLPSLALCRTLAACLVVTPGIRNMWLYPPPDDVGCFFSAAGTGMGKWGFTCSQPILYYGKDPYQSVGLGCRPNSCGQIYPNDANTVAHPCAKPLPMMRWLVNRASLEGMTVLDPFAGAYTIGVACVQLGRAYIGIELDPYAWDGGCKRIEQAYAQLDLFRVPATPPKQLAFGGA